jgi:hypothetical protein
MPRIHLAAPVEKDAGQQILTEGNYLCVVSSIKERESDKLDDDGKKKQLLLVLFTVDEGDFEGAQIRQTYSISDAVGRARFADFYQAVDPDWDGEGLEQFDTEEVVGKKLYLDVKPREYVVTDDEGNKDKRVTNDIKRGGYSPYEGDTKKKKGKKKAAADDDEEEAPAPKKKTKAKSTKKKAKKEEPPEEDDDEGDDDDWAEDED